VKLIEEWEAADMNKIDSRYPSTPMWVRLFIVLYPVIVCVMGFWLNGHPVFYVVSCMILLAWVGAVCVFFATTFRREGYQAAIDDLANGSQPEA